MAYVAYITDSNDNLIDIAYYCSNTCRKDAKDIDAEYTPVIEESDSPVYCAECGDMLRESIAWYNNATAEQLLEHDRQRGVLWFPSVPIKQY